MIRLSEPVDLAFTSGVAWLTLNRPDNANSIGLEFAQSLARRVQEISHAEPRVVVIRGSDGTFSAGGDVIEMAAAEDLGDYVEQLAQTLHEALAELADLDAVLIAAVDGVAAGAGLGLALATDIRIATDRALFVTAFEALSFTPDSGTSFLLPRMLGVSRAMAMSAQGMRLDATAAADLGLVHQVVPSRDLLVTVDRLSRRLAASPKGHMSATRALYRGADRDAYRHHLDAETQAITIAAASPDARRLVDTLAARSMRSAEARRRKASRNAA